MPALLRLPVISWAVYGGGPLTKQLNGSLKHTGSVVWLRSHPQLILGYVNTLMLSSVAFLPPPLRAQAHY